MPTNCWNIESRTPAMTIAVPNENSGIVRTTSVRSISATMERASASSVTRRSSARARSLWPRITNHRGVSGTNSSSVRNMRDGTASEASINLQPVDFSQPSSPCPAMYQFTK